MPKLSKWIRHKFARKTGDDNNAGSTPGFPGVLPVLPAQRPRPLTPTSSPSSSHSDPATAHSPFFQRLPTELRRLILVAAFGARVMHMDLEYDLPMLPRPAGTAPGEDEGAEHCGLYCGRRRAVQRDGKGKPAWRWWGSVCHRNPPWGAAPGTGGDDDDDDDEGDALWRDDCRRGRACACDAWPGGEGREKCRVGAMGWLRACRRAYAEGVDVLYATNAVHVGSAPLLLNLPRLLPPRTLEAVAAVEMTWDLFERRQKTYPSPHTPEELFRALVDVVPQAFPGLRTLYLSIRGRVFYIKPSPTVEAVDEAERALLGPVDGMVRRLLGARLRECTVEVPSTVFFPLAAKAQSSTFSWGMSRFWRPLPADVDERDRVGIERGYWVKRGEEPLLLTCTAF